MTDTGSIRMSQGLDVLQPKSGDAYPIPCREWDNLKARVGRLGSEPWVFGSIGSLLVGAALSTVITVFVGGINIDPQGHNLMVAWSVVAVTGLTGLFAFGFAYKDRATHRERASDIVTAMSLLEDRFEKRGE